jgi:hypothetical protein
MVGLDVKTWSLPVSPMDIDHGLMFVSPKTYIPGRVLLLRNHCSLVPASSTQQARYIKSRSQCVCSNASPSFRQSSKHDLALLISLTVQATFRKLLRADRPSS